MATTCDDWSISPYGACSEACFQSSARLQRNESAAVVLRVEAAHDHAAHGSVSRLSRGRVDARHPEGCASTGMAGVWEGCGRSSAAAQVAAGREVSRIWIPESASFLGAAARELPAMARRNETSAEHRVSAACHMSFRFLQRSALWPRPGSRSDFRETL